MRELYHQENERMRVAGLMSGSGSNLRKIIEHEKMIKFLEGRSPYQVVVIFSDNPASNAERIGEEYGIPVVIRDMVAFYREKGKPRRDLSVRAEFDDGTVRALKPFGADVVAYAGYMSIATLPLMNAFLGINVHPADLSIKDDGGRRRYTGSHAVRDAILAGEKQVRATTHIVEGEVDYGGILMISPPLPVTLPEAFDENDKEQVRAVSEQHQDKLKEVGDWMVFPKTLEYLADGRFSQDEEGNLYFDNEAIPRGLRVERDSK